MDIYRAPSQVSLGLLQYKLNTQIHACRHTLKCMYAHAHPQLFLSILVYNFFNLVLKHQTEMVNGTSMS